MSCPSRKFVAVLLAIWLPLFSGNALAASIFMQSAGGECHVVKPDVVMPDVIMSGADHSHYASAMRQHMQPAGYQGHQTHQHDQQNPVHKTCGVCQLACCGYLAAVTIEVAEVQPLGQLFTPSPSQFQSVTSAPLDPPPLTRA